MIRIESLDNPKVKQAAKLKGKGGDRFLVEGRHLVEMAAQSGCLESYFATDEISFPATGYLVDYRIIKKLSSSITPEPVLGIARAKAGSLEIGERALLLDRVQDPGNLGTLLRSALSFGFHDVIATPGTCSYFNTKAIQSSQGAIFSLNLLRLSEQEAVGLLAEKGIPLIGTSLEKAVDVRDFPFPKRLCLCLGNEGSGVSSYLLSHSLANVKIPIRGIDSLNVGVAGGILMYLCSV